MFKGSFQHTIDSKGRLSLPVRFRDLIPEDNNGKQLVITAGITEGCLLAYPMNTWLEIEKQILETPSRAAKDAFVRKFFGRAQDCAVDKSGRIVVPPVLREDADLKKEIIFVGAVQKFEIWDKARLSKFSEDESSQLLVQEYYDTEDIWI